MQRNRTSRRLGAVAVAVAVGAAVLSGCGGGAKSNGEAAKPATTIYKDAQNATKAVSSVQINGAGTSDGKPLKLDLVAGATAGGGSVTTSGATFQLVLSAKTIYVKTNASGWQILTGSQQAGQIFGTKWVSGPTSDQDLSAFEQFVSLPTLVSQLTPSGSFTRQPTVTFNGQKAIPLKDNGANKGTLYVAETGKPYILGLRGGGGNSNLGTITFTDFGKANAPKAPTGSVSYEKAAAAAGG